nr:hypothetical protein [uncultured Methanoregula sp.]
MKPGGKRTGFDPRQAHGALTGPEKKLQRGFLDPGQRTEVSELVDAVQPEDCLIGQGFLPDTDPAQLVTDYFYLLFSVLHRVDAYLAGDPIKRCIGMIPQKGGTAGDRKTGVIL